MAQKRTRRRAERRARPRAEARLSMRVEGAPEDGGRAHIVTESQNVSANGVYCHSSHYLAPLSKVALTLVLPRIPGGRPGQELIKCEGIVVRCEPRRGQRAEWGYELACMFSDLDERRRLLIDEFVTWRNVQALRAATQTAADARRPARSPRAASSSRRKTAARRRTTH